MARSAVAIKISVGLVVLAVVGVLFVRSAISTRAEPYTSRADWLKNWKLVAASPSGPSEPVLSLEGPPEFASELFRQVFGRSGESLSGPTVASLPLLLKGEWDRAFAGYVTPEALLAAARAAGLESTALTPRCLGYRRISAPGVNRQLYFVIVDTPAIAGFRDQLGQLRPDGGAAAAGFDPRALSPIVIVAASDAGFSRWLPLAADPAAECLAPLTLN